jgi:excisionase family DNA binding protein
MFSGLTLVLVFHGSKETEVKNGNESLLLTAPRAAILLGICTKTLHKLVSEGKIRAVLIGNRQKRFRRKDLENFVNRKA